MRCSTQRGDDDTILPSAHAINATSLISTLTPKVAYAKSAPLGLRCKRIQAILKAEDNGCRT